MPPDTAAANSTPIEPPIAPDDVVEAGDVTPRPAADEPAAEGGQSVRPQAPLDVRLLQGLGEALAARPRWAERPPSLAETWAYSTSGDWTTEDKGAKRLAHGLCVLVALLLTYPLDWAVQIARRTPGGFLLGLALLFVLTKTL